MFPLRIAILMALVMIDTPVATAAGGPFGSEDRARLETYARDTWRSIAAMTAESGLPSDALRRDGESWVATGLTSPTNIAAYLWSTVAAESLHVITPEDAGTRLERTLAALRKLERSHGFFYNWYDPATGAVARDWPGGGKVRPFLSSVDNGWLAVALMIVGKARPEFHDAAAAVLAPMDFGFFYDRFETADPIAHPGLLRGGYWPDDNTYSGYHYGTLNTEPRIASYVGIARGQLPAEHYYRMSRGGAAGADTPTRTYAGVPVVEGSRCYRGIRLVPSWDGTMFEALMVSLFVPEADWAPKSWGINHPLYVRAQIEHGQHDSRSSYWGTSAACDPSGGYSAFGVAGLRSRDDLPPSRDGVVTPHASFLALSIAPHEAMANLQALATDFPAYGSYGFFDSVDVVTGKVSDRVLILDQGMILASIANSLCDDVLRREFCAGAIETVVRPLIALERFEAGVDPSAPMSIASQPPTDGSGDAPTDVSKNRVRRPLAPPILQRTPTGGR